MHAAAVIPPTVKAAASTVKATTPHVAAATHVTTAASMAAAMGKDSDWEKRNKTNREKASQQTAPRARLKNI